MTVSSKVIHILDGGMGRELEKIGAPFKQPEWSALALMQTPELVRKVHTHFLNAGATVITTNAYALVPFHIGETAFNERAFSLAESAAKLAREAVASQRRGKSNNSSVAGCVPPAFGSYRPDLFDAERVAEILTPLIKAQAPFVDVWLIETACSIEEAEAVVSLIKTISSHPIWLSFSLQNRASSNEPVTLRSGEPLEKIAPLLEHVESVLFNCSQPEEMESALAITRQLNESITTGAYANSFSERKRQHEANALLSELRDDITPERYADYAQSWIAAGASIIGGCCGIGPEHIKAIDTFVHSDSSGN
ncbi:homocysteine S-methyltransferase family protein [Alteromonas sp. BL110]|uniref:homocysteine S-methyltransferase family protein n=1 Tax=Alteromonas sp. BL110 TaxID=1714845 RepID=UPI000E4E727A|nr:homocysteine S-methyltransferase family protein [Alteromonas sp. BL110]AXT38858.1 homocysteine S-methyltransferase family protein [Alteromonas sp. BL110]RKM82994.1 homocysteine S-methyltransferase family protein [Alteromonas sp. BL110]